MKVSEAWLPRSSLIDCLIGLMRGTRLLKMWQNNFGTPAHIRLPRPLGPPFEFAKNRDAGPGSGPLPPTPSSMFRPLHLHLIPASSLIPPQIIPW